MIQLQLVTTGRILNIINIVNIINIININAFG